MQNSKIIPKYIPVILDARRIRLKNLSFGRNSIDVL